MAVEAVVQGTQIPVATVTPLGTYNAGASQNSYIKGDKGDPGPQGPQGPQGIPGVDGQDGADGAAAGFGTPTASIDANTGTPGITVTASGPDTAKVFDFAFTNLKGATGDAGPTGSDGERGGITHRITGTIQGYSTPVGNYVPAGRIAIATVISQSGASDVIVGDLLLKADYVYGVGAVDATYAYVSAGTSIKGDKGDTGNTGSIGPAGPRGASILHVTTAPTGTPNDTYLYKIAISTVVSQSGVSPIVGDIIEYSYYHYPVAALDSTYAYLSTRISIRGAKGATGEGVPASGTTGQVLVKKSNTDYDTEWVNQSAGVDPATATPLMDGTAAVGTSTKYAREDHVHPVYNQIVRPNLLDNWYFVGGGSQLGSGIFPINQRGQTSYTGSAAYSLDRWVLQYDTNLQVLSAGTKISGKWDIKQKLKSLPSGIYTVSVLLSDYQSAPNIKIEIFDSNGTSITQSFTNNNGLITKTMSSANVPATIALNLADSSGSSEATIIAIKLELGDTQTLAHQENGTWVLNEIPDYDEQLYRCCASTADSGDVYANNPYTNVGSVYIGTSEPTNKNIKFWLDTDEPGMSGVSSVNGATGTVVLDADDVGAVSMDLLWTNASPTSAFAAQTIQLDLSGYSCFLIICKRSNSTGMYASGFIFPDGENYGVMIGYYQGNSSDYVGRMFNTVSSGIYAYNGKLSGGGDGTNYCIPYKIYGIKGVVTA